MNSRDACLKYFSWWLQFLGIKQKSDNSQRKKNLRKILPSWIKWNIWIFIVSWQSLIFWTLHNATMTCWVLMRLRAKIIPHRFLNHLWVEIYWIWFLIDMNRLYNEGDADPRCQCDFLSSKPFFNVSSSFQLFLIR